MHGVLRDITKTKITLQDWTYYMRMNNRRSKLECEFEDILKKYDVQYAYEVTTIPYTVPESKHKYKVDWTIGNGLLLETKGYLSDHTERMKYRLLKEQYPDLDLRFIFANPRKLCGGTKYTHAQWADKFGFKWCSIKDTEQIISWCKEKQQKLMELPDY